MSRDRSTGRARKKINFRTVFLGSAVIILGLLAWLVISAKDEAEKEAGLTFECNAERVEFINKLGYIVEPEPESKDITVPAEFNDSYTAYNTLQQQQGFDLLPYSGKEVTLYTYRILNYPDLPDNVVINMLFDDRLLIGADITYNDAEKGFTKPLLIHSEK